ncbi:MAG TPA: hypothetical protein VFC11_05900 [Methylocella sp.]|nr:hypothetical protein [Methylocella sp.]
MPIHGKARASLANIAKQHTLITYGELAGELLILPPHSIRQVTDALERLMEEDAAANRPFIAALVSNKALRGLPGPGFFDCARRLGRYSTPGDTDDVTFHAAELRAVFAC